MLEKKVAPKKVSRPTLKAYASYLASQLYYHRKMADLIDQKLKVLADRGVLDENKKVEDFDLNTLMRCKITDV